MLKFGNHIILDQRRTWPESVLGLIKNSNKSLENFYKEKDRIDELGRTNLKIRYNRPQNEYFEKWNEVTNEMENILKEHKIIGIHCTKLMDYEITDVLENGLKPLSKDFANERIKKLYERGLISTDLKNKIQNKNELSDDNRIGQISVFHCLSTLKDELGLNNLFGLWGGESIYSYLDQTEELENIGISCIVITSIPIKDLNIYPELSKRMLSIYFDDNHYSHDTTSTFNISLDVLNIIRREDKLFNKLTNIEKWDEEI